MRRAGVVQLLYDDHHSLAGQAERAHLAVGNAKTWSRISTGGKEALAKCSSLSLASLGRDFRERKLASGFTCDWIEARLLASNSLTNHCLHPWNSLL